MIKSAKKKVVVTLNAKPVHMLFSALLTGDDWAGDLLDELHKPEDREWATKALQTLTNLMEGREANPSDLLPAHMWLPNFGHHEIAERTVTSVRIIQGAQILARLDITDHDLSLSTRKA